VVYLHLPFFFTFRYFRRFKNKHDRCCGAGADGDGDGDGDNDGDGDGVAAVMVWWCGGDDGDDGNDDDDDNKEWLLLFLCNFAHKFSQVRKYLLRLETEKIHVKVWRPGVLLLVGSPKGKGTPNLIEVTNSLKKGGLFIIANILVGDWKDNLGMHAHLHKMWLILIKTAKWKAFMDLIIAPSVRLGVQNLVLSSGVGGMKPNTVVIGYFAVSKERSNFNVELKLPPEVHQQIRKFPDDSDNLVEQDYVSILKDINTAGKNLLIARNFEQLDISRIKAASGVRDSFPHFGVQKAETMTIDIWIVEEFVSNFNTTESSLAEFPHTFFVSENFADRSFMEYSDTSALIIQLGYILHSATMWKHHTKLRAVSIVRDAEQVAPETDRLSAYLYKCRVKADVEVLCLNDLETNTYDARALNQVMRENSGLTCLSFFPLPPLPTSKKTYGKYLHEIGVLSEGLKSIYLVRANEHVLTTEI